MRAHLGLGSNLGDREGALALARRELVSGGGVILAASPVEETAPLGPIVQPAFLNQVLLLETDLSPRALLALSKLIEERAGRRPGGVRWGPRELDVDILLLGDELIDEDGLEVPHPELMNRDFVRRGVDSVTPGHIHPKLGVPIGPDGRARHP